MNENPLRESVAKMDDISRYYKIKSQLHIKDEYHEQIAEHDLWHIKKAFVYVLISPFAGLLFVQLFGALKDKFSMSRNYEFHV